MRKKYTLNEMLKLYTVEKLKRIIRAAGVYGYSKLRKAQLIELVILIMQETDYLQMCFLVASDTEIKDFELAINTQVVPDKLSCRYSYWVSVGLAMEICDEEICVPIEIEEKYKRIKADKTYHKVRKRFGIIDDYALACTNLYSIIEIDKFMDIINSQNKPAFDMDEVVGYLFLRGLNRGFDMYFYMDDYIMHEYYGYDFLEGTDDYECMLSKQENKPYYIPPKERLLRYTDELYFERDQSFNNMLTFMKNNMGIDHEDALGYCSEMKLNIREGCMPGEVINGICDMGVSFKDELQMQAFMVHFMELYNNTRIWENRGYTPKELLRINQRKHNVASNKVIQFPFAVPPNTIRMPEPEEAMSVGKIGRNEPCPCGSGKKYKNCCGKNK